MNGGLWQMPALTPKTPLMKTLTSTQEDIAVRAYYLYLEEGCQNGRDLDYWLQAEKDVGSRFFTPPTDDKPVKAAKKPAPKKTAPESTVTAPAPVETPKPTAKKTAAKKAAAPDSAPKKPAAKKKG